MGATPRRVEIGVRAQPARAPTVRGRFIRTALVAPALTFIGCATRDASDPEYGKMFKQATRDRVEGK